MRHQTYKMILTFDTTCAKRKATRVLLIEVMHCIDKIGKTEFDLQEAYAFENELRKLYPNNRNIQAKIRQQLQVLRDNNYLDFIERGRYRLKR